MKPQSFLDSQRWISLFYTDRNKSLILFYWKPLFFFSEDRLNLDPRCCKSTAKCGKTVLINSDAVIYMQRLVKDMKEMRPHMLHIPCITHCLSSGWLHLFSPSVVQQRHQLSGFQLSWPSLLVGGDSYVTPFWLEYVQDEQLPAFTVLSPAKTVCLHRPACSLFRDS